MLRINAMSFQRAWSHCTSSPHANTSFDYAPSLILPLYASSSVYDPRHYGALSGAWPGLYCHMGSCILSCLGLCFLGWGAGVRVRVRGQSMAEGPLVLRSLLAAAHTVI